MKTQLMFDFRFFHKQRLTIDQLRAHAPWDVYIAAIDLSDRVRLMYEAAPATRKYCLVLPEYGIATEECPPEYTLYAAGSHDEAEFVLGFLDKAGLSTGIKCTNVCIDMTGMIRSYLLFLLFWLFRQGVTHVDLLYCEPEYYTSKEATQFSGTDLREFRPIRGFEGGHFPGIRIKDFLVIGGGYESHLVRHVAQQKESARKFLLLGFPPLQPDMYQESVIRAYDATDALSGSLDESCWLLASAKDPYHVANTLQQVAATNGIGLDVNLYLSPLGPKPQAVGFFLYFLLRANAPATSVIYPFPISYSKGSSAGISDVWLYEIEFDSIRKFVGP